MSVIFTIIEYALIYSIYVGWIVRPDYLKEIKLGRVPVAESSTEYTLVFAP